MKKLISILLVATMMMSMGGAALAAETSYKGRNMVLYSIKGSDISLNKGGLRSFKPAEGTKLSQGNTITTGAKTQGWFLIDDDKVTKLDSNSKVSITKATAKQLKLTLVSGNLSMDVKKIQDPDSTLEVAAGNSTMGIRGTIPVMGYNNGIFTASLLTGKVVIENNGKTYTVEPGERFTADEIKQTAVVEKIDINSLNAFTLGEISSALKEHKELPGLGITSPEGAAKVEELLEKTKKEEQNAADKVKTPEKIMGDNKYVEEPIIGGGGDTNTPPVVTPPEEIVHTVRFVGMGGTLISEVEVKQGKDAIAPTVPNLEGYTFTGWDKAFTNVMANLTVTAQYTQNLTLQLAGVEYLPSGGVNTKVETNKNSMVYAVILPSFENAPSGAEIIAAADNSTYTYFAGTVSATAGTVASWELNANAAKPFYHGQEYVVYVVATAGDEVSDVKSVSFTPDVGTMFTASLIWQKGASPAIIVAGSGMKYESQIVLVSASQEQLMNDTAKDLFGGSVGATAPCTIDKDNNFAGGKAMEATAAGTIVYAAAIMKYGYAGNEVYHKVIVSVIVPA